MGKPSKCLWRVNWGPAHPALPGRAPGQFAWSDSEKRRRLCMSVGPWETASPKASESSFVHCFRGDGPLEVQVPVTLASNLKIALRKRED